MKTNPFAYLKKAPKLKGYRVLRPSERIKPGDLFMFLDLAAIFEFAMGRPPSVHDYGVVPDDDTKFIRIGVTLAEAREDFLRSKPGLDFDGAVYRLNRSKK